MSQQMSPVIALDIALVAQKVKVQCWRPVWSEKSGCWWVASRSGWLLELLTELINYIVTKKTKNLTSFIFIYHSVYTLYLIYIFLLLNLQPDDTIDLNANQQFWSGIGQWPSPFSNTICGWLSVHGHIFQGAKIVKRGTEVSENSRSREFSMRVSFIFSRSTTRNDFLKSRSRLETWE